MSRRDKLAVVAGAGLAALCTSTGLVWSTRSIVASGYRVGSYSVVAGILAAFGVLVGFAVWAVFGPRYREQEARRGHQDQ